MQERARRWGSPGQVFELQVEGPKAMAFVPCSNQEEINSINTGTNKNKIRKKIVN